MALTAPEGTALASRPAPLSPSLVTAAPDLAACSKREFATALTPCLALAAGIGFKGDDRTEWLQAAYLALEGVPADLIKRGARAAMLVADHPSKIVPAIMEDIGPEWRRRRLSAARAREYQALPAPDNRGISEAERQEVGSLMKGLIKRLEANGGPI